MAKKKTAEPVITLYREVMADGNIYLSSPKGIIDKRSGRIYSEVICAPEDEHNFKEAED